MSSAGPNPHLMSRIDPRGYPRLPASPSPGEYRCPECGSRVTVGPSGTEYGHRSLRNGQGRACSRRPRSLLSENARAIRGEDE